MHTYDTDLNFVLYFKVDRVSEDIKELAGQSPQAGTNVPQKKKSSIISKQSVEAGCRQPTVLPLNGQKGPLSIVNSQRRSETYQNFLNSIRKLQKDLKHQKLTCLEVFLLSIQEGSWVRRSTGLCRDLFQ